MDKKAILDRLDIKGHYLSVYPDLKIKREWGQTHCKFGGHQDVHPSLFMNLKNGSFHCKGCGMKGSIFDHYMKVHGVDFPNAKEAITRQAGLLPERQRKIVKTYSYVDEDSKLLFQVVRYDPKGFSQRRPDGKGGWIYNLEGITLVPYNLPEVIKTDTVFIVEGEKDVENLRTIGITATTCPMGAGKWRDGFSLHLKDKDVVILPDNDPPGKDHALKIARNLHGIAESVKVVELPDLPEKGDISDWINLRDAKDTEDVKAELLSLVEATPEWEPKPEPDLLSSLLKWNDVLNLNVEIEYLIQNLIPKGSITLLFGRGGIGKTSLCLKIGRVIAEGVSFGELQTIKTPVYYIDFENPLSVLKQRVENIGRTDNLWIWHISNNPMPPRLDNKEWESYKQLPPGLLIFDTLRASHLSDENNSQDMAIVIARLKELREAGFTILLLHHTPKGNEGIYKGSTALLDLVDHVLSIESVKDADGEPIEFDKDNLYRLGARIKTRYEPYHVFLKFNPAIKGFEFAKDPDIERIETLYEMLKDAGQLMQKDFKERAKSELDLTEGEVRKLLKKGKGMAWDVEKGGYKNRALNYIPKSNWIIGQHIYSHPINQLELENGKNLSNYTPSNNPQPLDNPKLDNRTNTPYPINQLEVGNGTEHFKSADQLTEATLLNHETELNLFEGEL